MVTVPYRLAADAYASFATKGCQRCRHSCRHEPTNLAATVPADTGRHCQGCETCRLAAPEPAEDTE